MQIKTKEKKINDILEKFLHQKVNESSKLLINQKQANTKKDIKRIKTKISLYKYIELLKKSNTNINLIDTEQKKKEKYARIKELKKVQKRKFQKSQYFRFKGNSSLLRNYRNIFKNIKKSNTFDENIFKNNSIAEQLTLDLKNNQELMNYSPNSNLESLHFTLTVKPNNIFIVLRNIKKNKIVSSGSAEQLGFSVSKKKLKTVAPLFITKYLNYLKSPKEDSFILGNYDILTSKIIAPNKLRKRILKIIRDKFVFNSKANIKANFGFFDVPYLKSFNGCRASKKIRKKRKGLLLYK
jgi:hypothetical protein